MACGIGVCMTCVLPVVGRGRADPLLPLLHRGPGVRRRPGALRRRRHAALGRRRRRRDGSGGAVTALDTAVDMSTALGAVPIPSPVLTASGCSAFGAGAGAVRRPHRASARWSPSRCSCARARAGRRRGWPRRRAGCSTRSACRARASTGCSPRTCPGWPSAAPGRSSRSPAPASRTSPSWPSGCAACPGVLGLEVNISCPNVESRGEVFACDPVAASDVIARRPRGRRPGAAGLRQAQPRRHRHRRGRPRGRRRRRRRAVDDQHPARAGHRPRHHAAGARRGHRRALRAGDPAGGAALRLAGAPGAAGGADPRHGRHPQRPGRPAVRARRRVSAVSVGTAVFNDPSAPARVHDELADGAGRSAGSPRLREAVGYAHR